MAGQDPLDETRVIEHEHRAPPRAADPFLVVAVLAGAVALFMLVLGIVTLARTGLPTSDLTSQTTVVGPFERSTLMGIIEIIGGLAFAGIAASRRGSTLTAMGLVLTVFGLVWLIEPNAFGDALGVNRATAWIYLLFGVVSTGVGFWAPDVADRVVVRR
jgi:hypothetical protein